MRFLPQGLVIHRWCPRVDPLTLAPIGISRDGRQVHLARIETIDAFRKMSDAARAAGVKLHVIWAYRSPELQEDHFKAAERKYGRGVGIRWLAPPGYSEHQTGWVLDIGDETDPEADDNPLFERTAAFRWLQDHAKAFEFELSFKPGNWQGISYEPWHWRFVGTPEARRIFHPAAVRLPLVWGRSVTEAIRRWAMC